VSSDKNGPAGPPIGQAPGDLALVQRFVNTRDIELATDDLASPAALAGWLQHAGLLQSSHPAGGTDRAATRPAPGAAVGASPADLRLATDVREALRGVLRAHAGHGTADGPASALARIAAGLSARPEVGADGSVRVAPGGDGVRRALARLLLVTAEATALGTWPRLKACSADDCQWAFYDRSPTQNACWCTMQICGSRAKSRAYRQRSAAGANAAGNANAAADANAAAGANPAGGVNAAPGRATASRSARTSAPGA
jgi:predicted RNA-binding Zn ribbon-like protein